MRFDIITIFPEFFDGPLDYGIVRRARASGIVEVKLQDLREFTHDRHRTVDDRPFGGGEGMVLKPEPLFEAVEALGGAAPSSGLTFDMGAKTAVVLLSASGKLFSEAVARRLSQLERVALICGRYEGVDERVSEHLATDEISVGDFVLSGGELPAAIVLDAVTRLLPGALGNEASSVHESFSMEESAERPRAAKSGSAAARKKTKGKKGVAAAASARKWVASLAGTAGPVPGGVLDCPHYTRPAEFREWPIPKELMSGNHEEIRRWRRFAALEKTLRNRPELLARTMLTDEEVNWLEELHAESDK
jgi:tRNA (guanine37-N1)-methyltransferase